MSDCCSTVQGSEMDNSEKCPSCMTIGKKVKLLTIKSMLKPATLSSFDADSTHFFCSTSNCDVVYFDSDKKAYFISEIKVPVHQKDASSTVPVCYCFDWTKEKITQSVESGLTPDPISHIRENIKENRCGCEVNNPQGSCCLGNVTKFMNQLS
ncbi:putative iron-sulfur cluster-binding metallochaperone [Paenibacillus alginolyticus]|uniref:(2Fe-2S)-binding protein n=1 Tax=Paenibacillus alginolyticus TaxID=59839 RepID=A0ABT4GIZ0_9BACL|nr:(2Fe-2S)-binding protein [Paenibacillus alginolyticus]MCY9696169.1 (2Fe-2S)-binding protein [Paenibacillus alginolyticus]MEC0143322.1 (2Fe-2S)-binding protein [Paenibacillus alginolyticus]